MYKCDKCEQLVKYDYFAVDGLTCMDCVTEEQEYQWSLFELAQDRGEV